MSAERHLRASELFLAALERPAAERQGFLEKACQGDAELRAAIEELLLHHVEDSFLEVPPIAGSCPSLPERIGSYRVHGVLGRGGMGVVYDAEQESPRRRVAVKVVNSVFLTEEAVQRFRREGEVLGRLDHPGIARIIEAGTAERDGGRWPFFAMERVDGLSLDVWMQEEPRPVPQRLVLFLEVCAAVHHAHQKGVIHRDLKPSNILVERDGRARVLDFGIARAVDADARATLAGQLLGTLPYMSPEQASGDPDLDIRSDVYTLGVILYELLAGRRPYELDGRSLPAALEIIRETSAASLPRHRELSGDLRTIVLKTLEKDRERRYQSALELSQDLQRLLRHEPIQARPPSTVYHLRKFTRRNRVLVAGAAAVVASVLLGWRNTSEQRNLARAHEKVATQRLLDFNRLADMQELFLLQEEVGRLTPPVPERRAAMEHWLARARELVSHLPGHREARDRLRSLGSAEERALDLGDVLSRAEQEDLAALRAYQRFQEEHPGRSLHVVPRSAPEEEGPAEWAQRLAALESRARQTVLAFPDPADGWMLERLEELVRGLEDFEEPPGGALPRVEDLQESARTLEQFLEETAEEWAEATTEIYLSEQYAGLELAPQLGLVPLGPDPDSGLWEFWHVLSGERPERDAVTRRLEITEETGIVLVLIPGGEALLGAQQDDPALPHYDPYERGNELVHTVPLSPFFLSKHEVTQAQWQRAMEVNPAGYQSVPRAPLHPVEQVSWIDGHEFLMRLDLEFPTEAQWEYAARAGTDEPWWTGYEPASLVRGENLADRTYAKRPNLVDPQIEPWNDGHMTHAPVGSFAANPFGLHDVCANVSEWCKDRFCDPYPAVLDAVTGEHLTVQVMAFTVRCVRGGNWNSPATSCRAALRGAKLEGTASTGLGLRAARRVDP